ncbi:hypothetical protein ACF0H5_013363 [Mactra antiquata]
MADGNEPQYDFYVLYEDENEEDEQYAREIVETLERMGNLKGFVSYRDDKPNHTFLQNAQHALTKSRYVLLLVSNSSVSDGFWDFKTTIALCNQIQNRRETVVPIFLPELDEDNIPMCLSIYHGVSYENDPEANWSTLRRLFQQ